MERCTAISEKDMGSVELSYCRNELSRFIYGEEKERTDRVPLIRSILSDERLRSMQGFLLPKESFWKDPEFLLRKAGEGLAEIEAELHVRR